MMVNLASLLNMWFLTEMLKPAGIVSSVGMVRAMAVIVESDVKRIFGLADVLNVTRVTRADLDIKYTVTRRSVIFFIRHFSS